jgi:hypothetical protein
MIGILESCVCNREYILTRCLCLSCMCSLFLLSSIKKSSHLAYIQCTFFEIKQSLSSHDNMSENSYPSKRKTKASLIRRARASKVVKMEIDPTSPSNITDQKLNTSMHDADDVMKCYFIVQMESLIFLMKNTLCIGCSNRWNGSLSIPRRDGLYVHLAFTCSNCGNVTDLHSSPKLQDTKRHEVNVRLAIGGTLSGIGHSGVKKLLGVMNLPAPVDEEYYSKTQTYIIDHVSRAQEQSMAVAVSEAVLEGGGNKQLTVSGDGAWLTRGHTSAHGVAALCSTARCPKILDTNWLSKRCSKCQGSGSLRQQDPELFEMYKEIHNCQINYEGKFV